MAGMQGTPCWYELATSTGNLESADRFYSDVMGWSIEDSGMEGFDYHLARATGDMVAGLMTMPDDAASMPPFWLIYFAVDDGEASVAEIEAAGGRIYRPLAEIPGTGRFAIAADPQGAGFGVLEPAPMADGSAGGNAFDQQKMGHGNWHELMTSDPDGAFAFYSRLFGWQKSTAMPMGEMGTYQLFSHRGGDIGAVMSLGNSPAPNWLPYFGVDGVKGAIARIEAGGGKLVHGPVDVPGGAFIAVAQDPQGAYFAVVGPN